MSAQAEVCLVHAVDMGPTGQTRVVPHPPLIEEASGASAQLVQFPSLLPGWSSASCCRCHACDAGVKAGASAITATVSGHLTLLPWLLAFQAQLLAEGIHLSVVSRPWPWMLPTSAGTWAMYTVCASLSQGLPPLSSFPPPLIHCVLSWVLLVCGSWGRQEGAKPPLVLYLNFIGGNRS